MTTTAAAGTTARAVGPAIVIAADTVVTLEGKILGKPRSSEDARKMLEQLSGRTHSVLTGEQIDWSEIAALYEQLAEITHSPVVELNRAVAVAQAGSVGPALEIVNRLELGDYQYLHSTRGELLRRLGRTDEAREAFERALELARSERERRFLERRIAEL